jgi:hypothetical protein
VSRWTRGDESVIESERKNGKVDASATPWYGPASSEPPAPQLPERPPLGETRSRRRQQHFPRTSSARINGESDSPCSGVFRLHTGSSERRTGRVRPPPGARDGCTKHGSAARPCPTREGRRVLPGARPATMILPRGLARASGTPFVRTYHSTDYSASESRRWGSRDST